MRFYRAFQSVAAMTFDLDDTLYDNAEVIRRSAEQAHLFLQNYHPALKQFSVERYQQLRNSLREQEPEIYHDVSEWRRRTVVLAMLSVGLSAMQAEEGASAVMAHFAHWRNQIMVPEETHRTLATLAKALPLVAITNGNAEPQRFGLAGYFQFILRAGTHGRAKPWHDMFQLAASKLTLPPSSVLHVGDDLTADVAGALQSGMQACWINPHTDNLMCISDARMLPTLEISRLATLTALL